MSRFVGFIYFAIDVFLVIFFRQLFAFLKFDYFASVDPELFTILAPTVFLMHVIGGYKARTDMVSLTYASQHVIASLASMLFTILILYVFGIDKTFVLSRTVVGMTYLCFVFCSLWIRRWVTFKRLAREKSKYFVVIGKDETGNELQKTFLESHYKHSVKVFNPDDTLEHELDGLDKKCSGIIILPGVKLSSNTMNKLLNYHFTKIPVWSLNNFYEHYFARVPFFALDSLWFFEEGFVLTKNNAFESIKQVFDILLSFFAVVIFAPVMALIAVAIKVDSPGPVIFLQNRYGKNKQIFNMLKFRTMAKGSDAAAKVTAVNDERITRVGRILRLTHLDELPQFFNVLLGEMSLIGPRAEWVQMAEMYEQKIENYSYRLLVKPGITGWAQVSYPYVETLEDTRNKLMYDLYYVRNYSFLLDVKIIFKTIHVIVFGKGR